MLKRSWAGIELREGSRLRGAEPPDRGCRPPRCSARLARCNAARWSRASAVQIADARHLSEFRSRAAAVAAARSPATSFARRSSSTTRRRAAAACDALCPERRRRMPAAIRRSPNHMRSTPPVSRSDQPKRCWSCSIGQDTMARMKSSPRQPIIRSRGTRLTRALAQHVRSKQGGQDASGARRASSRGAQMDTTTRGWRECSGS